MGASAAQAARGPQEGELLARGPPCGRSGKPPAAGPPRSPRRPSSSPGARAKQVQVSGGGAGHCHGSGEKGPEQDRKINEHVSPASLRGKPRCSGAPYSDGSSAAQSPSAERAVRRPGSTLGRRASSLRRRCQALCIGRACIAVPNKTYASPVLRDSRRTISTSTGSSPCHTQRE